MRTPALVAVESEASAFASLFAAARGAGVRAGWLDLSAGSAVPEELVAVARTGAAKVVTVSAQGTQAFKPARGEPVLRDLLREHFVGFAVVLVRGRPGWPRLAPAGEAFRLEISERDARVLAADGILRELLRPRHRA